MQLKTSNTYKGLNIELEGCELVHARIQTYPSHTVELIGGRCREKIAEAPKIDSFSPLTELGRDSVISLERSFRWSIDRNMELNNELAELFDIAFRERMVGYLSKEEA